MRRTICLILLRTYIKDIWGEGLHCLHPVKTFRWFSIAMSMFEHKKTTTKLDLRRNWHTHTQWTRDPMNLQHSRPVTTTKWLPLTFCVPLTDSLLSNKLRSQRLTKIIYGRLAVAALRCRIATGWLTAVQLGRREMSSVAKMFQKFPLKKSKKQKIHYGFDGLEANVRRAWTALLTEPWPWKHRNFRIMKSSPHKDSASRLDHVQLQSTPVHNSALSNKLDKCRRQLSLVTARCLKQPPVFQQLKSLKLFHRVGSSSKK